MVYLVRGLPGSGKSTYCRDFLGGMLHLEADMYFSRGGEYKYNPDEIVNAHKWCFSAFCYAVQNDMDVAVANTFVKKEQMRRYVSMCRKHGVPFKVIRCTGGFGSVHKVPQGVLDFMRENFEDFKGEEIV